MLEVFTIMATNKLLVAFGDEVTKVLSNLPKGTKSKFVNMCVEHVISDQALRNQLVAKLLFNDEPSARTHEYKHEKEEPVKHEVQSIDTSESSKQVPRAKFKFK